MSETDTELVMAEEAGETTPEPSPEAIETVDAVAAPVEADIPEAIDIKPGERYVPVSALQALREELKALKPKAARATELEQELNAARPYADFVRANPQLMQPPTQPAPAPNPEDDPDLVELARTVELYDGTTGKPDVGRAKKVAAMIQKVAEQVADRKLAPVQERSHEQAAATNLQSALQLRDANGHLLEEQYLVHAVKSITSAMSKADALRVLSDPQVTQVIGLTALGLQASAKKSLPAQPAGPAPSAPLAVESAGGSLDLTLGESSRKLARMTGRSEEDWAKAAKRYVPGKPNSLE